MLEKLPEVIGQALHDVRAGLDQIAFNNLGLRTGMNAIELASLAFVDHGEIPARYTADGEGVSPPLSWVHVPDGAASLLLLVEDADSPTPHPLVHAIVAGLEAADGALAEGAMASEGNEGIGLHTGRNSYLQQAWLPPDPPPGHGWHRYAFQIFALAADAPELSESPGREEVLELLATHAVASGLLIGRYERPDTSIQIPTAMPLAGA